MGWNEADVYMEPEKFGLKTVTQVNPYLSYEFDMLVFWQDIATGELYYGEDRGCSCPSPFETFTSRDDLLGPVDKNRAYELLDVFAGRYTPTRYDKYEEVPVQIAEAKSAIAAL
jgi:hypothetical protein